jgi:hypothetical protein
MSASLGGQTSGSENEIEKKTLLLKGDVTMSRSSLLDFFNQDSWIKKSNFEGIFNLFVFAFIMVIFNLPILNYSIYGRFFDPDMFIQVLGNTP